MIRVFMSAGDIAKIEDITRTGLPGKMGAITSDEIRHQITKKAFGRARDQVWAATKDPAAIRALELSGNERTGDGGMYFDFQLAVH